MRANVKAHVAICAAFQSMVELVMVLSVEPSEEMASKLIVESTVKLSVATLEMMAELMAELTGKPKMQEPIIELTGDLV